MARSPSRSLSLPRLANVIPTFYAKASWRIFASAYKYQGRGTSGAPRVFALAEPSTLFTTMALIKEGSRSPGLVPPLGGVLVEHKALFGFQSRGSSRQPSALIAV